MPVLRVVICDPPLAWQGSAVRLVMCSKLGETPPRVQADGSFLFEVDFQMKADRKGDLHPSGPAVVYHGDGRRFVYFGWWGDCGEGYGMFRRLKVFFDKVPHFEDGRGSEYEVQVRGKDPRGGPACATAVVISAFTEPEGDVRASQRPSE